MPEQRILLSAYACEPGLGSEPGVGWHWAVELAKLGHDVWVLTRASNRPAIERGLANFAAAGNLHFLYYDLPRWAGWWKKGRRGVHLYYLLWQWGAYGLAKKAHAREQFDLVHHITFGTISFPSFMGGLGIPFLFGPAGGGERAPLALRRGYSLRDWIVDGLRDLRLWLLPFDPLMNQTFQKATWIFAKTPESRQAIPKRFWAKTCVELEIGVDALEVASSAVEDAKPKNGLRVLYVGRFLYWKGLHLGLPAFAALCQRVPNARLTLIGSGPSAGRWAKQAQRLGIEDRIDWHGWMPQAELLAAYGQHDVLLFPSLHDSSGNVVLEALAKGLPVLCLDLGGPSVMVNAHCGRVVATKGRGAQAVIAGLADALVELAGDPALRKRLSQGAKERVRGFEWKTKVARILAKAPDR